MEDEGHQLDLEGMVSSYTGHNRVDRLLFIADRRRGQPIELEALRLAHDDVKKTENIDKYTRIVERIAGRLGAGYSLDRAWVSSVERGLARKQEQLDAELANSKANLVKESIRMGHMDLGDHFYAAGDLQNAFKNYVRARDYCTSSKHVVAMCMAIIRTAIELPAYVHVSNYVMRAENTPEAQADGCVAAKLAAASGLGLLHSKRYKQAAKKFLEVSPELGSRFNDVLAMQDVALYGTLCALASFSREDVGRLLIRNTGFKELLDTVPEIRDIAHDFHACRYARALAALSRVQPTLLALDPHMEPHAQALLHQVRQRALIQYTSPFTSVRLETMAAAFGTTAAELGKELSGLIVDGQIPARIDAHAGVLYARHTDERSTTFRKALTISTAYVRDTKAALLRLDLLRHDFMQKPRPGARGAGASSGGALGLGYGPGDTLGLLGAFEGPGGGGAGHRLRGPGAARHMREREQHMRAVATMGSAQDTGSDMDDDLQLGGQD